MVVVYRSDDLACHRRIHTTYPQVSGPETDGPNREPILLVVRFDSIKNRFHCKLQLLTRDTCPGIIGLHRYTRDNISRPSVVFSLSLEDLRLVKEQSSIPSLRSRKRQIQSI